LREFFFFSNPKGEKEKRKERRPRRTGEGKK
jgi:hypothetical protein